MLACAFLCASVAVASDCARYHLSTRWRCGAQGELSAMRVCCEGTSNPVETVTTACDSWSLLNGSGAVGRFTDGASDHWLVRNFTAAGQGGFAFTQGSKDIDNRHGGWHYSSHPTPDKDTLENVYAAAYAGGVQKDPILVFGAERNSINGAANIGIWFFQQDVQPDPNSNNFVGDHVNNDVFLVFSFTGGGVIPTISIYIWNTGCGGADQAYNSGNPPSSPDKVCAGKNVEYVTSKTALCSAGSQTTAGAVTNQSAITLPWPSVVKSGGTTIPAQAFSPEASISSTSLRMCSVWTHYRVLPAI